MNILVLLLFGGVVGRLSGLFIEKQGGVFRNVLIGIIGSLIGGALFNLIGAPGVTGFNLYSLGVGIVGAILFVGVVHAID